MRGACSVCAELDVDKGQPESRLPVSTRYPPRPRPPTCPNLPGSACTAAPTLSTQPALRLVVCAPCATCAASSRPPPSRRYRACAVLRRSVASHRAHGVADVLVVSAAASSYVWRQCMCLFILAYLLAILTSTCRIQAEPLWGAGDGPGVVGVASARQHSLPSSTLPAPAVHSSPRMVLRPPCPHSPRCLSSSA